MPNFQPGDEVALVPMEGATNEIILIHIVARYETRITVKITQPGLYMYWDYSIEGTPLQDGQKEGTDWYYRLVPLTDEIQERYHREQLLKSILQLVTKSQLALMKTHRLEFLVGIIQRTIELTQEEQRDEP